MDCTWGYVCWNWIGRAEYCSVTSSFAYWLGGSCTKSIGQVVVFNYNMKITGHTFLSLVGKVMEEQK